MQWHRSHTWRALGMAALAASLMLIGAAGGVVERVSQAVKDSKLPPAWGGATAGDGLDRYILDVPTVGPAYGSPEALAAARATKWGPWATPPAASKASNDSPTAATKKPSRASRASLTRTAVRAVCANDLPTSGTGGWRRLPQVDLSAPRAVETIEGCEEDLPEPELPADLPVSQQPTESVPSSSTAESNTHRAPANNAEAKRRRAPASNATALTPRQAALKALEQVTGVAYVQPLRAGGVFVAVEKGLDPLGLPGVKGAQPASTLAVAAAPTAAPTPDDQYFSISWGLRNSGYAPRQSATTGVDTEALAAWGRSQGSGSVVAVIDTGVALEHPDLARNIWTNPNEPCASVSADRVDRDGNGKRGDCRGWNFYLDNADVTNAGKGWHGTGVAGAIAAVGYNAAGSTGLAPRATLLPLVAGAGTQIYTALAIDAAYYAVDAGATVLTMAFAGELPLTESATFAAALGYAAEHQVNVVTAAGNDHADRDTHPLYPASLANLAKLTVGAHAANDTPAEFSGYGKRSVDLFAPGAGIVVPDPTGGYALATGTSISAGYVSAAVALVATKNSELTAVQRAELVRAMSVDSPAYEQLSASGGRLSAALPLGIGQQPLAYVVDGIGAPAPGEPINATFTVLGAAPTDSTLRVQLLAQYDEIPWAVPGTAISVAGRDYITDAEGAVEIPLPDGVVDAESLPAQFALPAGEYGVLVVVNSPGRMSQRPAVATFTVAVPNQNEVPKENGATAEGAPDSGAGFGTPTVNAPSVAAPQKAGDQQENQSGSHSGAASLSIGTGSTSFDGTDAFGVTSIGPRRLPLAGGVMTIRARSLPANAAVMVGGARARVLSTSNGRVYVMAPPRVAGDYTVVISAGGSSASYQRAVLYLDPTTHQVSAPPVGASKSAEPTAAGRKSVDQPPTPVASVVTTPAGLSLAPFQLPTAGTASRTEGDRIAGGIAKLWQHMYCAFSCQAVGL